MVMPKSYDDLVEAKMHKVTQMSEAEIAKEIAEIQGGAKNSFEGEVTIKCVPIIDFPPELFGKVKKKRGRPLGSRNKPKV